ncbi:MAG TPA: enolase C-terminal domain-like protein, partial [Polyangiaceae bacterium]|nr:enolase C-terminal domain-like protein [Polyangiaceae bacterium]
RCVVLKPTALGGLAHCRRLVELSRRRGVGVVLLHCFDGPFAWRATAALALAIGDRCAHGLAPHGALRGWDPTPLPIRHGTLESWSEPGLGFT